MANKFVKTRNALEAMMLAHIAENGVHFSMEDLLEQAALPGNIHVKNVETADIFSDKGVVFSGVRVGQERLAINPLLRKIQEEMRTLTFQFGSLEDAQRFAQIIDAHIAEDFLPPEVMVDIHAQAARGGKDASTTVDVGVIATSVEGMSGKPMVDEVIADVIRYAERVNGVQVAA